MPNATIASPLTPGNGWAPSIPLQMNLKDKAKVNVKDLMMRAKAGMQAGDVQKEAHLTFYLGVVNETNKDFKEAIKSYKKFYSCAKLMEDKIGMALALNRIAINYYNDEKFEKSVEFHIENTKLTDFENAFAGFYNLGISYRKLQDYQSSIDNFFQALAWTKERNELESECLALGQIGITYLDIEEYEQANVYLTNCFEITKQIKNQRLSLDCLMILNKISGKIDREKDISAQRKLLINALDASAELGDQNAASICCINLGILEGSSKYEEVSTENSFFQEIDL